MPVFLSILESVRLIAQLGHTCSSGPPSGDKGPVLRMDGAASLDFPSELEIWGGQQRETMLLVGSADLGGTSGP